MEVLGKGNYQADGRGHVGDGSQGRQEGFPESVQVVVGDLGKSNPAATTPLQGNASVIAYADGITKVFLTGKNTGAHVAYAIPVTYKGQNLYFKGTWGDLTSNGLYPDGYYYALTDTTFYGVVKPTDPSVKLDAPFLNGSTWFYYFDGGVTIYSYKNNVWTGNTFLNAQ